MHSVSNIILILHHIFSQVQVLDSVVGHEPEIKTRVPPQNHTRAPEYERSLSLERNSNGSTKPEGGTNADGSVESDVNLGFESKSIHPFPLHRGKNSISNRDGYRLMNIIPRNGSWTQTEILPANLAPVSPPPLRSRRTDEVRSDAQDFDMLRFSSSSPSALISGTVSSLASAPGNLYLDRDKDGDKDDSWFGFSEHLALSRELRRDMRVKLRPDLNMRTGSDEDFDEAVPSCNALRYAPTGKFINELSNGDSNVLEYVAGTERKDMGGSESFGPLAFDHRGPASPISRSASAEAPGVSAVGSLFTRPLDARSHIDNEDADSQPHVLLDSRTMPTWPRSTDHREGGEEELEECGLLKSLLGSSDPWGLMRRKALNLPSTPEEVEMMEKVDLMRLRGCFGRRGVGYVTPPSMDALLGLTDTTDKTEKKEVWQGGLDDDEFVGSQEILDSYSSQHGTGLLPGLQNEFWLIQLIDSLIVTRHTPSNINIPRAVNLRATSFGFRLHFANFGYLQRSSLFPQPTSSTLSRRQSR